MTQCSSGRCRHCSRILTFDPEKGDGIIEVLLWTQHWLVGFSLGFFEPETLNLVDRTDRSSSSTPALHMLVSEQRRQSRGHGD